MLLNSMGAIILQLSDSVNYKGLGFLESFKDIPMALVSLFCVNWISKYGNKKALYFSLIFITISSLILPVLDVFWFLKVWLSIIGVGFAIAKISVFSMIKNNFQDQELSSTISSVDAAFMIGIFFVNIGFGALLDSSYDAFWKYGFWMIAVFCIFNIWLLKQVDVQEQYSEPKSRKSMDWHFLLKPGLICFFALVFFMVFVEQSFNSWLPSFFKNNLKINSYFALQSSAFLALFSFLGRWITSKIVHRFHWFHIVSFCIIIVFFILIISQLFIQFYPEKSKLFLMIIIPMVGFFLSPLFPLYNSEALKQVSRSKTQLLVSFVVIFSSLGSSAGSLYMAFVFHKNASSYYLLFIFFPLLIIFGLTFIFNKNLINYDRESKN